MVFRAVGWLFLVLAIAVTVRDGLAWWSEGAFSALSLGGLWSQLDFASLQSLEAGVVRRLSGAAWSGLAAPVLMLPALPVFVVLGLAGLWFGRSRDTRRAEPTLFLGARPPRRRRGRGLS